MQTTPAHRTNRDLFSTRYLEEYLPETEAWNAVGADDLREAYEEISRRWERAARTAPKRDESALDSPFVRSVLRALDVPFAVDETADRPRQRSEPPSVGAEATAREAADPGEGSRIWETNTDGVAVAAVGPRSRSTESRASGEHEHDFDVPGYRIHGFLREASAQWAVLTNGRRWRLYHASTSHRPGTYYEIDLPSVLETGDLEDFKYFYCFFRREAFLEDAGGDCFLDEVFRESTAVAEDVYTGLQQNAAEALEVLADGFRRHPDNDLDEDDLDLLYDSSLVYLYRLLVVCYAESEGHDLFDADDESDESEANDERSNGPYSLAAAVSAEIDGAPPTDGDSRTALQSRLETVFERIDEGRASDETAGDAVAHSADDGWLFRPAPDEPGHRETRFLATHSVGDAALATVIDLLTGTGDATRGGTTPIDYSSLDASTLGRLYETLLEYSPSIARDPLALEDGEYVTAAETDDVAVEAGEVYLTAESGERKASGSYYTPEYLIEYVVENTLEPLVAEIREDVLAQHTGDERGVADAFADRVFELSVLDPAMGCGHFLAHTVDYLARAIVDVRATAAARHGPAAIDDEHDIDWVRRHVARQCIYGVDCDPLAVELARLSLWLGTHDDGQPPAVLDHHLKTGNALVGSDLEEIPELAPASGGGDETLERPPRRQRLAAMANVRTAREFGLDGVPDDAVDRMAAAVDDDDAWERIARAEWFEAAQTRVADEQYFHWELEFPAVFAEDGSEHDESKRDGSGFDAVVGNPPWVATAGRADISATIDPALRTYLVGAFDAAEEQFDLAVALYERAVRQSRDGRVGLIVPDSILTREQNEAIREFVLTETSLSRIVRVGTAFPGVEAGAVVCISGDDGGEIRCADATEQTTLASLSYDTIPQRVFESRDAKRFLIYLDDATRSILETIERRPPLKEYATVSRGEEIGKRAEFLSSSRRADTRPIVPGGAVRRYGLDEEEIRYVHPDDVAKGEAYYRSPKLVFRQTGDSLVGTYDASDRVTIKSAYGIHAESASSDGRLAESTSRDVLKHLLAVLNSPLSNFYHHYTHAAYRSVFPQINQSTVESVPIAMAGGPDPTLVGAVDERLARTAERSEIPLDVLEDVGRYEDGESLGSLTDCRPVPGVDATKLAATTEEWPNLQIGSVDVTTDRSSVVVSASVRYKPDDESLETDRWGYAETDPIPALEVGGGDGERAALLEAFVPAAVDAERGTADFRATATKTISPLERLEALTLPRLEDVTDDLRAFRRKRARAEELDDRIATLDRLIADRVFDLYGLSAEDRERVRREFGGR